MGNTLLELSVYPCGWNVLVTRDHTPLSKQGVHSNFLQWMSQERALSTTHSYYWQSRYLSPHANDCITDYEQTTSSVITGRNVSCGFIKKEVYLYNRKGNADSIGGKYMLATSARNRQTPKQRGWIHEKCDGVNVTSTQCFNRILAMPAVG